MNTIKARTSAIAIICSVLIAFVIAISININYKEERAKTIDAICEDVINEIISLSSTTSDFLLFYTKRSEDQWSRYSLRIDTNLNKLKILLVDDTKALSKISRQNTYLRDGFKSLNKLIFIGEYRDFADEEMKSELSVQLLLFSREMLLAINKLDARIKKDNYASLTKSYLIIFSLLGLLSAIIYLILWWVRRAVVKPLKLLQSYTESTSKDFNQPFIVIKTNDEFQLLGDSFNVMNSTIKEHISNLNVEIKERKVAEQSLVKYKENLEITIEGRTRELKEAQEHLLINAHKAGKAEVATGVLHNIGNVLTGLLVSADIFRSNCNNDLSNKLQKVADLID